ncbi:Rv3654c family TadE-like protein [Corynebacterium lactis]|uniref:Uncharacterized protein n=1 Tax=Corynebacterium lactis RW2-5 TaxID=1408189 RepID=A0A0K2GXP1_9CORY|nr:Rv3654c family TadE-like protein [Corynebacterium lactis]ALA66555.1 hypothetical protein CLAC_01090 [Corynebacterium lactis RW2-5]
MMTSPRRGTARASALWRDETGATTVLAALLIAAIVGLMLVGVLAGKNLIVVRQAAVAADLSAVAGAIAAQEGDRACDSAGRIARANHAAIVSCDRLGEDVQVTVERSGRRSTARAGPAEGLDDTS